MEAAKASKTGEGKPSQGEEKKLRVIDDRLKFLKETDLDAWLDDLNQLGRHEERLTYLMRNNPPIYSEHLKEATSLGVIKL